MTHQHIVIDCEEKDADSLMQALRARRELITFELHASPAPHTLPSISDLLNGVGPGAQGPVIKFILQRFEYAHLPPHLQERSRRFAELACWLVATTPDNPDRAACLEKLREAKDRAVSAVIQDRF